ncbi:MAG: YheC/YheD family protein [Gorillibacterium sp.]|nr:YheC/YheD family protein [Gorillibacterium sp.]
MARVKINLSLSTEGAADEMTIYLGSIHMKRWKLSISTPYSIRLGTLEKEVRIAEIAKSSAFRMHPRLAEQFGLHKGAVLCLQYQQSSRVLVLGPLLGVLLTRIGNDPQKPFGSISSFCRELTTAGQRLGVLVYFFSAAQLPNEGNTIQGWTYDSGWKQELFPLPDVVYNRLTSRVVENRVDVQKFMQQFKSRSSGGLFNERYLNKAEVFEALHKDEGIRNYLPESRAYKGKGMLKGMLERYSSVFLKPTLGSLGKGIIRVHKNGDGTYSCHAAGPTGAIRKIHYSSLIRMIEGVTLRTKGRAYLLQEGLDLISVGGCPLDFRALVQRDEFGLWRVTSIVARIAARHTFVSNLARGGKLSTVDDAITGSNLMNTMHSEIKSRLEKAALAIATGLEIHISDAHFAEFGIDLAVDTRGRVMLLEVNSKPSKEDNAPLGADSESSTPSLEGTVRIRPSVRRAVQYSRFLAKF